MSCPRPHGKSLMQLGSRQRCLGSWVMVGYFPSLWLQSKRILICRKLASNICSPQMWLGCHLMSESFGEEIHVPVWKAEGSKCDLFGLCSLTPRLWTFCIPLLLTFIGWFLSCHRTFFWGGSVIYPVRC